MNSIRVLEVIRQGKVGGGESHLISLIENINQSRYVITVLSFTEGPMVDHLLAINARVRVIATERAFDLRVWSSVKNIITEECIDVIHVHGTRAYTNVVGPARQLRIPVVYTVHGWSFHDDQSYWTKKGRLFCEKLFVRLSYYTILVSQSDKITGEKHFGQFRSLVIPNGVDTKKFSPTRPLEDLRTEYKVSPEATLIGYIARITYQKDPLGMIEGFRQAIRQAPDLRLLMVGEGELLEQAQQKVRQLGLEGVVWFSSFRSDIPAILKAIDIYCLPSLWEGMPIGLLEAMAMGKAVIATRVNGSEEVIQHQKNGLLIESQQPQQLAEAILRLKSDKALRKAMQRSALATVSEKYSVDRMTRATEDVYEVFSKTKPSKSNGNTHL